MFAKTLALAAVAGMASAFVPSTPLVTGLTQSSSALKMGFENEVGAQPPLGFYDPLRLLKGADEAKFNKLRAYEIKHGRVAMLAVLGHITQQRVRFPGYLSESAGVKFSDLPNGLTAFSKIPPLGLVQMIAFIAVMELVVLKPNKASGLPQDFGIDWVSDYTDEEKIRSRAVELNNGRAAMMGIWALVTHELINGRPYVINDLIGTPYTFP
mmetsp:Transcript_21906/g.31812  ORF Transcript_21906/g.31812 Transcript_21906/m.31812 type:complete len:211 (-) Transcript_21906:400-1032(-)